MLNVLGRTRSISDFDLWPKGKRSTWLPVSSFQVLHLNGIAGVFRQTNTETAEDLNYTLRQHPFDEVLRKVILDLLLDAKTMRRYNFDPFMRFNWETGDEHVSIRQQAIEVIKETDVLVIIGYSFPPDNERFDTELIESIRSNQVNVIYQDPSPPDFVVQNLRDNGISVRTNKDCRTFHIAQGLTAAP